MPSLPSDSYWHAAALAATLLLIALLWLRLRRQRGRDREARDAGGDTDLLTDWHPQATRVLTAPERLAFLTLSRALPEYMVLAQVPLARFIRVPTRRSYAEWLRRVGHLSPDLLVCDAASQVIAAIEVRPPDGRISPQARERLARIRRVLSGAGIPLHVWLENTLPTPEMARESILRDRGMGVPPVVAAAQAAGAGTRPAALDSSASPISGYDVIEDIEWPDSKAPNSSTWFDDLFSGAAPLGDPQRDKTPPR